jgi:hypothetical protein
MVAPALQVKTETLPFFSLPSQIPPSYKLDMMYGKVVFIINILASSNKYP